MPLIATEVHAVLIAVVPDAAICRPVSWIARCLPDCWRSSCRRIAINLDAHESRDPISFRSKTLVIQSAPDIGYAVV